MGKFCILWKMGKFFDSDFQDNEHKVLVAHCCTRQSMSFFWKYVGSLSIILQVCRNVLMKRVGLEMCVVGAVVS